MSFVTYSLASMYVYKLAFIHADLLAFIQDNVPLV